MSGPELGPRELAEREGKPLALAWIASTQAALASPGDALTRSALATNFAWARVPRATRWLHLGLVAATFTLVREILEASATRFAEASEDEARAVFPPPHDVPPAYAVHGDRVFFTPRFAVYDRETGRGFGPKCRAAMVLHEAVHVCDRRSGEPRLHVSEWDEPRFSALSPEDALHNPSAYASFAAQVHERALEWPASARFGAGNPTW